MNGDTLVPPFTRNTLVINNLANKIARFPKFRIAIRFVYFFSLLFGNLELGIFPFEQKPLSLLQNTIFNQICRMSSIEVNGTEYNCSLFKVLRTFD